MDKNPCLFLFFLENHGSLQIIYVASEVQLQHPPSPSSHQTKGNQPKHENHQNLDVLIYKSMVSLTWNSRKEKKKKKKNGHLIYNLFKFPQTCILSEIVLTFHRQCEGAPFHPRLRFLNSVYKPETKISLIKTNRAETSFIYIYI